MPFLSMAYAEEIDIQEWDIPTSDSSPHDVVVAQDGTVWFTEIATNKIGKFDPNTEQFAEYVIPTPSSRPHGLVADNSGNIWFTEVGTGKIGKFIVKTESFEEYETPTANSGPHTPIFSDENTLWFTEQRASKIGKLDVTTGQIQEFPTLTDSANPYGIITDKEGNAWFAELRGHHIGKVDAKTGEVTEYAPPTDSSGPRRIAIDNNGMLWFTEYNSGKLGKFNPSTEEFTEYDTSSGSSGPYAIWVDSFDNIWFSLTGIYKLAKFDQNTQTLHEYELPSPETHIKFIHIDNDGNVWFPNYNNNKIGVVYASTSLGNTKTIFVGPNLVDCVGVAPQKCMQIREDPNSQWLTFYDTIDGFDYQSGYTYELKVLVTEIENPPTDASGKNYQLIEIVEKTTAKHTPYMNMCAPGFVPLDEICVLNDRCGPGAYPGKVCVMDGAVQPYLRPLQQGNAGISAENIICAEGLQLVFNPSDGSPACVEQSSSLKLQERGWTPIMPSFACTLEYAPVCGVDNQTYGNICMLNGQHIAMKHKGECSEIVVPTKGVFKKTLEYTEHAPQIDETKGYFVDEIADGVYWLVSSGYQTMFVTTGEGVVVVDAPQPIGEKYLDAINDVTSEPITHMIYSHHHADHTGAAGQIFLPDITYISHKQTADVLMQEEDANRPIPTQTFEGNMETINVGNQTIELHYLGNFHSNGDVLIMMPEQKVAMLVDLLRPAASPYRAFGVTPDIDLYLEMHDTLQNFDFDVLVSGHTEILASKDHIKTNKEFTLDVMDNAKQALETDDPTQTCIDTTIQQWQDVLVALDTFMADHCNAMIEHVSDMS